MRKFLGPSLFIALSLILVLLLGAFMPKYNGMLKFFFVLLLLDGYLWVSVRGRIKRFRTGWRIASTILFWLLVALLLCLVIYSIFLPFLDWNRTIRTYLPSIILVLSLAEFFPILTLVLADLIRLFRLAYRFLIPGRKTTAGSIPRLNPLTVTGWIVGAGMFLLLSAGMIFGQFNFKVRTQTIALKELPVAFDGLKIVQFSDVHLGSWGVEKKLQEAMDEINALQPDVIFFTGDMFNFCTADGNGFERILKTLRAPYGIYAILGNHDYGDYIHWPSEAAKRQNMEDLKVFYKNLGWKLLLNSHDMLKRGTDSIAVIGVENWGATRRFQRRGDIAMAQKGTETIATQLLLSHDPSHWDSIISKKYPKIDVTFAGHTHGGQFGIDCCNIHWSPIKWFSRLWCGLYQNPDINTHQYLYVNQGLGNIGYAGRVGIMPEITLIILKRQ